VVVRVYHCDHVVVVVVVIVSEVRVVVAMQAVLQLVQATNRTDALSVSYSPGAQVERSSRCS
jgi:hypothetical protein